MIKKWFVPLAFVLGLGVGGLGAHFYEAAREAPVALKNFSRTSSDHSFTDRFFQAQSDPFEQMDRLREEMLKDFPKARFNHGFADEIGGSISELKQEEDDRFVYYKLDLKGLDKESVKIDVDQGQLSITGSTTQVQAQEDDTGTASTRSEFHQSFARSFPVPAGVDETKVDFRTEGDELVIKFPKTKEGMI